MINVATWTIGIIALQMIGVLIAAKLLSSDKET